MASRRIQMNALTDEVKRTILRESVIRYRNEIASDEERMLYQNLIKAASASA